MRELDKKKKKIINLKHSVSFYSLDFSLIYCVSLFTVFLYIIVAAQRENKEKQEIEEKEKEIFKPIVTKQIQP